MAIHKVHVIFKTHLDLGFTDTAENVKRAYFQRHIPMALDLARSLREAGGEERFVWTTGSWLIYEFLEEAAPQMRRSMEAGIVHGDVVWHGLPFTTHTELMDASLFRFGLSLSRDLDRRFGRHTIAAKMTDVAGHTRSIVPYMAEAGLRFLHIGVNTAWRPPDVPPLFVWQAAAGESLIVNYSKGGYGAALEMPGLTEVLVFAHTGDNAGPQAADDVRKTFEHIRAQYPGARVIASTLDAFTERILPLAGQLPVITEEIGDTWIHGTGADPKKVAQFRALCRWRAAHEHAVRSPADERRFRKCSRHLLCIPEHTWGKDVKTYLADYANYSRARFQTARRRDVVDAPLPAGMEYAAQFVKKGAKPLTYSALEASWTEQRNYIRRAVAALGRSPMAREVKTQLAALHPHKPSVAGLRRVLSADPLTPGGFAVRIDPATGALNGLTDTGGRRWADKEHLLGVFRYELFAQEDYDRFFNEFCVNMDRCYPWAIPDMGKPGMATTGVKHGCYLPQIKSVYYGQKQEADRLVVELGMPAEAVTLYGAPQVLYIEYRSRRERPCFEVILQWFEKPASRLPEAMWFSFNPRIAQPDQWRLDKLGLPVSPLAVVKDGNRYLHGIGRGARYEGADRVIDLESLDVPLVAPGEPRILVLDNRLPDLKKGLHFNLYNNLWGTNFPMWYEEDGLCRFRLNMIRR